MDMFKLKMAIIASGFVLPGLVGAQEPPPAPAALVEVDQVRNEMIAQQIWVPGTVVSRSDSGISAEVPGRITWMAEVGDRLKAGDVLARIDDHMLQLNYQQNIANIGKWQASVTLLTRKQDRFGSMVLQANTSKDQYDEIISQLEIAKQELQQAKIDQQLTQYRLQQSQVKSPFNAMVVERMQSPGEYVSVGQTLLRIVDTNSIEATIRAPLSAVPFIEQGMSVLVKQGSSQQPYAIRTIVPVGNAQSRMMEVRVPLDPSAFSIGSAVRVALPHSEYHQAITVPRDALVLRKSGTFVYQVDEQQAALKIAVTTGIGIGDRIEVFGQLNVMAPVVIRGAERLTAGQKVRYSDSEEEQVATL